jgi:arabinan endo-1,5-alpha-L-arabinosidase
VKSDDPETRKAAIPRRRRRPGPWAVAGAALASGAGINITTASPAFAGGTSAPMADPDVIWMGELEYMFGTSNPPGQNGCGGPDPAAPGRLVPETYALLGTGPGSNFDGKCVTGEAFAPPQGWWGDPFQGIWAPSVVEFHGQWHMYYTALVAGTGQRCIGHAVAGHHAGPYVPNDPYKWACPPGGRWAIDPDAKVIDGRIVVAYRDDAVASGPDTGISIVATDANGWADWNTRRTALTSHAVGEWAWNAPHATKIVENPTLAPRGDGSWDLFFSGGEWNSANYGTGVAHCGSALQAGGCKMMGSTTSPYFGFSGNAFGTQHTLPDNHPGPGGMDAYKSANGWRAAWHWWKEGGERHSQTSTLSWDGNRWKVG